MSPLIAVLLAVVGAVLVIWGIIDLVTGVVVWGLIIAVIGVILLAAASSARRGNGRPLV